MSENLAKENGLKENTVKEFSRKDKQAGKSKIYRYASCGLMAALICIAAPNVIPIGPVPISLTNLVLYFAIFILGTWETTISYAVYLLLGIVGLPVFSGYVGGIAKVAGPTGGYLLGFFPMIILMGLVYRAVRKKSRAFDIIFTTLAMVVGTAIAYAFGTAWFVVQCKGAYTWQAALALCVFPFIPFDLAKIVIANILGRAVRVPLVRGGLIE